MEEYPKWLEPTAWLMLLALLTLAGSTLTITYKTTTQGALDGLNLWLHLRTIGALTTHAARWAMARTGVTDCQRQGEGTL